MSEDDMPYNLYICRDDIFTFISQSPSDCNEILATYIRVPPATDETFEAISIALVDYITDKSSRYALGGRYPDAMESIDFGRFKPKDMAKAAYNSMLNIAQSGGKS